MRVLVVFVMMAFVLSACSSADAKKEAEAKKQSIIWQQDQAKKSYEEMDRKTGN